MSRFLPSLLHLIASLFATVFVIPVFFIILFAMIGIYDSVGILPLGLGGLSFMVYWLWRLIRGSLSQRGPYS